MNASERRVEIAEGGLRVLGATAELAREARAHGLELLSSGVRGTFRAPLAGQAAWVKSSPLRGRARTRHALAFHLARRHLPRVREYHNLAWLRAHGFQAPEPLAALVWMRRGTPRHQVLWTRELPDSKPLGSQLDLELPAARAAILDELASEIARMHALRFVHHDLHVRNLLVLPPPRARRVAILDTWAGGPPPNLRGPAYDLACFFLEATRFLGPAEQGRFLRRYLSQRREQGRPAGRGLLARAAHLRARLRAQLEREPARLRGAPLPSSRWDPRALAASAEPIDPRS